MGKKIIFTGGGTAGHVMPNIPVINELIKRGWEIEYIGRYDGIEKRIIENMGNVKYYGISSGKLRRYYSVENFKDPFRVIQGIIDSITIIKESNPDVIFSKGGFVAVPVAIAAWIRRVPLVIHESDTTVGLANKIAALFAKKMCVSFYETLKHFGSKDAVYTGTPIREELVNGSKEEGYKLTGFDSSKETILVMGGSIGSVAVNKIIREVLDKLLEKYQVVHICGKGNIDESLDNKKGYKQYEYIDDELNHLYAISDLIISRAGANSLFEILANKKPNILIPLPSSGSRGDQILNAEAFVALGYSRVLKQEHANEMTLLNDIDDVMSKKEQFIENMSEAKRVNSVEKICEIIESLA